MSKRDHDCCKKNESIFSILSTFSVDLLVAQHRGSADASDVGSRAQVLADARQLSHLVVPLRQRPNVSPQRLGMVHHVPAVEISVRGALFRPQERPRPEDAHKVGTRARPHLLESFHAAFEFIPAVHVNYAVEPGQILAVLKDGVTCGTLDGITRAEALVPKRSSEATLRP